MLVAAICIAMTPGWTLWDYKSVTLHKLEAAGKIEQREITLACGSWDQAAYHLPADVVYLKGKGWRWKRSP